jgi:outer membrane lipoprotein-sorting protein
MQPNEQEPFEDMQRLLQEHYGDAGPSEPFADRLHGQLLALLPATDQSPTPATQQIRFTQRIGGLTMRQRIGIGLSTAGVAAVIAIMLIWGGSASTPASAMEKMAEGIRNAASYRCVVHVECSYVPEPGKPPVVEENAAIDYWLAPDSSRFETRKGQEPEYTQVYPARNGPWIHIDHRDKTFARQRYPTRRSPLERLGELGHFSGKADRELGTRTIDGRKAVGFEIEITKIDPHLTQGKADIWLDAASNLPVRCRYEFDESDVGMHFVVRLEDIQWDIHLSPTLFEATPPKGYKDVTLKPLTLEEQTRKIVQALRIYAEASGGHYPKQETIQRIRTGRELCKLLGVDVWLPKKWPREEGEDNAGKAAKAINGFGEIEDIQTHHPDAAYHGKTVGPKDKDKVLLRWKLDDGRYEVIFGDLRAETVTAERLHALEK